jgi:hypothetical protein
MGNYSEIEADLASAGLCLDRVYRRLQDIDTVGLDPDPRLRILCLRKYIEEARSRISSMELEVEQLAESESEG